MAKLFFLFTATALLSASITFSQSRSVLDLIGVWSGNPLRVEFTDNSNVSVVYGGEQKRSGTYTSDFFSDPAILEMSYQDGNNKDYEFKCLIQFLDNNTLKWQAFKNTDSATTFTDAFYILKRVKN